MNEPEIVLRTGARLPVTERINNAVDAAIAAQRVKSGCWCSRTRKPCEYHAGVEDGAELALRVLADQDAADVDDWRAGA